jgi:membrane protein
MKKIDYRHSICIAITLGFVVLGVFEFFGAVGRLIESCRDIGLSAGYYFCELFQIPHNITPTVNDFPKIPFFDFGGGSSSAPSAPSIPLPDDWQGFTDKWSLYWQTWATSENLFFYLAFLGDLLYMLSMIILCVLPVVLVAFVILRKFAKTENNDYGKDTKPLRVFKRMTAFYRPVKAWFISFTAFLRERGVYWKIWLALWLFYFNVFTIVLEFIAFYLYFVVSFDFINIYRQVYKLFLDLWPVITFIPLWAWVIISLFLIDRWRKKIGYAVLNHNEMKNRGFINERPIVIMVCGTMGKKKTTMLTDIALSQQVMFKDKAFEKILENDLKFPYFPWINLENAIKRAMSRHEVYNLATCRRYIDRLSAFFYAAQDYSEHAKAIRRHLRRKYRLCYDNLCFGYDYERYGFTYDDKLKVVTVWEVLKTYAQLYFIYVIQSSLIISNYSVRSDSLMSDTGNFPLWNTDFFRRDSRYMDSYSRHSHILDFDSLRLGRKVIENNPFADSFEFGVIDITEVGKERKNMLELKEMKKREEVTNQKNDGFNDWLKMIRHSATVDNFPFVKVITDEQRPESWGADARDLCEIVHIRESGETRLAMPFFFIGELLYSSVFGKFVNLYYNHRFTRGDNTLSMHLLKTIAAKIQHYYSGIYNTFGYCTLGVQVESGTQDGQFDGRRYYLASKKIYSKRFSTDCFSDFFTQKALRSPVGIDDLPEYRTEKATFAEMDLQNSYFFNDLKGKELHYEQNEEIFGR